MNSTTEGSNFPTIIMPTEEENRFPSSMLTFAAVMTFVIMVVGICGNLLTIIALIKYPKVRNVAAAFIISLCLADLIFCMLVLPFSGIRYIQGTWTHGELLCKLIPFIQYGNVGVSLLCIGMITINRYVMIAHHSCYEKIYKKHWIALMLIFCWMFSYGMQLPTLLGVWGTFGYDPKLGTCSIMNDELGHSSKTTLFITAFVIPCIIIIACYTKIFWVVRKSEQRLKHHTKKQNSIPNNLRSTPASGIGKDMRSNRISSDSSFSSDIKVDAIHKPSDVREPREIKSKRNEWRITKMVLAIFLSFVVCYLPITIAKVADRNVEHPNFHIFSYIMLYLSACINPIIYVIMNKQYRKAYKTVITCKISKLLSFTKPLTENSGKEKWKDAAMSSNHSRTLVSQISNADHQSKSLNCLQLQPIALETKTKATCYLNSPKDCLKEEVSKVRKTNNAFQSVNRNMYQREEEKEMNRITLVDGDTILEA
ncbi:G-protein coupled receptor moody isoform X3 [Teleopsis dalmanni]|uniref:G-protein coupled receptor moody isoform X3 n=1 Tax=Teleopsis dalmanni TaxID=139649 RepID=UPI0018CF24E0|nr:G-protein coupled receptor moody isoform X3 [Teleopsis dalmanni]